MSQSSEQMRQMEEMIQGLRQQVDTLDRKPAGADVVPSLAQPPAAPQRSCHHLRHRAPEMRVPALPPLPPPPANAGLGSQPEAAPAIPRPPGIASFEVSDAKPGTRWRGRAPRRRTFAATSRRARSFGRRCSADWMRPPAVRRRAIPIRC
jgi:hypothetical protein